VFGVEKANFKSFENKKAHYLVRFLGQSKTLADIISSMRPSSTGISVKKLAPDSSALHVD